MSLERCDPASVPADLAIENATPTPAKGRLRASVVFIVTQTSPEGCWQIEGTFPEALGEGR